MYCAFKFKGFSPFAAQILAGAVSFAADEIIKNQENSGKKVSYLPNVFSTLFSLILGSYSLWETINDEEQVLVEYANSYIVILNGMINGW